MLYDRRDFGLLRLTGAYQWLPLTSLRALSPLKQLYRETELLASLGLLTFSRNDEYFMPTPEGYQFLSAHDLPYQPPSKRPYAKSPILRRRLEVGLSCSPVWAQELNPLSTRWNASNISRYFSRLSPFAPGTAI